MNAPQTIGRYRILSILGAGGFATVYLAEDPRLDVTVAIKILADNLAHRADIRARFIKEAQIMRRLAGPGLVAIHDIDEHEDRPYFVMEHCERGTLTKRLTDIGRPLEIHEAVGLVQALSSATAGIHKAGVVHRDLKPSNFLIRYAPTQSHRGLGELLSPDEELVVADFGLAKVLTIDETRVTVAGGSPGFSAPEQFRGEPAVNTQADVYALSAIVVYSLSGEKPQTVRSSDDEPFSPQAINSAGHLKRALSQGLAFNPSDRQPNAMRWLESFDQPLEPPRVQTEDQPQTATYSSPGPHHNATTSRRRLLKTGAVCFVGAAGATVLAISPVRFPGPKIIGPTEGLVGDEAVFAVDSNEVVSWTVNDQQQNEARIVSISPTTPDSYKIRVTTTLRSTTHTYAVTAPETALRIDGPGLAPANEATIYTASGAEPSPTWTIAGTDSIGNTIELNPSAPGPVKITLKSSNGDVTTRTITAAEPTQ